MSVSLAAEKPSPQSSISVLVPAAVDKPFTYLTPHALEPGTLVVTRLTGRKLVGAVWDAPVENVPAAKLKPIESALDTFPPLTKPYRDWLDWVADFTLAPKGAVLALAALALANKTPRKAYVPPVYEITLPQLTKAQQEATDALALALSRKERERVSPRPLGEGANDSERMRAPILLDGVTGSGKTEVYFSAIAKAVAQGGQVLVLLPEIALTHQWLERFEKTFGARPCMWHSRETPATRTRTWQAIARGEAKVVVGARSALFLPFKNLAFIVVDEEHDATYKQDDGVLYHARDMAVARAKFEHIPIVLASATPSLETLHNVAEKRYRSFHLPERFGAAGLPAVQLIDMVQTPPERGAFLSPPVKEKLLSTLAAGQQSLLFLNRRGYAPLLLCRGCGHRFQCDHCSAWLIVHGKKDRHHDLDELLCHHCGHHEPIPLQCPKCEAPQEKLAPCGPGVERIAEEVRALVPDARLAILSSDEQVGAGTWATIERGEVDILVGTQMAAKGHHFPNLTFVAVVDADLGLEGADLRAAERTYQLLHQLGGRAGRADARGEVLIQTWQPAHPVMQALLNHDRERIMALEMLARKAGHWPPYGQLAAILLDGVDEAAVRRAGQLLAQSAPEDARLTVLGPAPAPLSKLRDQYRFRLLVKARKGIHLQRTLIGWLKGKKFPRVRIKVDVNPYYFQ